VYPRRGSGPARRVRTVRMRADSRAGWRRVVPGRLGPEVGAEGGRRPVPGPGVDGPVRGVCRCTKVTNPARS